MNIVILHYHLNRAGIARVISSHLRSLDKVLDRSDDCRVAVVYGGRQEDWDVNLQDTLQHIQLTYHVVPALDYDLVRTDGIGDRHDELLSALRTLLVDLRFTPCDTIIHAHNHCLGKNVALPTCLIQLAEQRYPLLLQIHDFAEDIRPANYETLHNALVSDTDCGGSSRQLSDVLYPQAPHIHYAVLNGRDRNILASAGLSNDRLHWVPNPVSAAAYSTSETQSPARRRLSSLFGIPPDKRLVLYPVRCIARKNLGELLLYAAVAPSDTVFGVTLPPINELEQPLYERWKNLAQELGLEVYFELGAPPKGPSLAANFAAADSLCTTSLAEGFGMVYLESWVVGRPLFGRDLPEITEDFKSFGLNLDGLRPSLLMPVDWVGRDVFETAVLESYEHTLRAYGRCLPSRIDDLIDLKIQDGLIDFGDLTAELQFQAIRTVREDASLQRQFLEHSDWLNQAFQLHHTQRPQQIQENVEVISKHLSEDAIGRTLTSVYQAVLGSERGTKCLPLANGERILDRFLAFERFRPLRGLDGSRGES